jgi:ubiquitin C-terminal hydrolase
MDIVQFNNLNFNKLFAVFECLFNIDEHIYNKYYYYLFNILFKNNYTHIKKFFVQNITFKEKKINKKGCIGFINNSNFCYMNSVLQSFLHTPVFIKYFINLDFYNQKNFNTNYQSLETNISLNLYTPLFNDYLNDTKYVNNQNINSLDINSLDIKTYQQVFDNLCLLFLLYWNDQYINNINIRHFNTFFDYIDKKFLKTNQNITNQNSSHELIYLFINEFTCFSNHIVYKITEKVDNIKDNITNTNYIFNTDISLSIEKDSKLENCIDNYFINEKIYTDNILFYNKQFFINQLNNIVIFNIKRESYKNNNYQYLDYQLEIPLQINLDKYFDNNNNNTNNNYNLYSFIEYVGNVSYGHYLSYCKNIDNNWYKYNDNIVQLVNDVNNILKSNNVVLLFYYKNY